MSIDNVNHPKHYADTCSMECIESMIIAFGKESVISFCKCNAYKYLWRYKNKNGSEDLKKAGWYVIKAIELCGKSRIPDEILEMRELIAVKEKSYGTDK